MVPMAVKAFLFDFNGVIINDESLHEELTNQLLLEENLRPKQGEFKKFCLGRNDRGCIYDLFTHRGRLVSETYFNQLIKRKSKLYLERLLSYNQVPVYGDVKEFLYQVKDINLTMAIVSGAVRSEIDTVLRCLELTDFFSVVIAGDDIQNSKPDPDGYLLAVNRLNQKFPELSLTIKDCIAVEDTPAGIQSAKRAGIPVIGVANTYPLHMLQRQANWAVDYLMDLELDRL